MSRVLQRLVVWLAFAGALLVPALARAALIPSCDAHEQLTRMPSPTPADPPPEDACSLGALQAPAEDVGDVRVAAMCDVRGASAIAPQRVLPISDARIEAAPACGADGSAPAIGSGPDHPLASAAPALADHAVLDPATLIPPPSWELAPPYPPVCDGPLAGFDPGIDHPPR